MLVWRQTASLPGIEPPPISDSRLLLPFGECKSAPEAPSTRSLVAMHSSGGAANRSTEGKCGRADSGPTRKEDA